MRRVVANSTPLIILGNTGYIELLHTLYTTITIPRAVYHEVCAKDDDAAHFLHHNPEWIHVEDAPKPDDLSLMNAKLHAGEIETIMLARTSGADLTIIDDGAAKKVATHLVLTVTGTLGVLTKAKKHGHILHVKPIINAFIEAGFYITPNIQHLILTTTGEA